MTQARMIAPGPVVASQVEEGSRYELSNGYPIYCAPGGGRHSGSNLRGGAVLFADPAVEEAGVDVGHTDGAGMLRAPDVSVGNVPNEAGWVKSAPPLAVEYADKGTSEADLVVKIGELLDNGARWVWVVRLVGEPRVEVHEAGKRAVTLRRGEVLRAPGVLKNEVPVEAMFDKEAARKATLRGLLNREGYESLDDVRAEGEAEGLREGKVEGRAEGLREGEAKGRAEGLREGEAKGKAEGLRAAIETACELLGIELTQERRAQVAGLDVAGLSDLLSVLRQTRRWPGDR